MKTLVRFSFLIAAVTLVNGHSETPTSNPEIRVQLSTSSSLVPIYVGKFSGEPSFEKNYLSQLESILNFDLNYNGTTKVLPFNEQREKILAAKDHKDAFTPAAWKGYGLAHAIKLI